MEGGDAAYFIRSSYRSKISIHATRGGWRPKPKFKPLEGKQISIHATRGGWRLKQRIAAQKDSTISIHATRGGWRRPEPPTQRSGRRDFNPRHPWRVATPAGVHLSLARQISIHATRGGWRRLQPASLWHTTHFNPRHPWRVATGKHQADYSILLFQSTPPVEGGDQRHTAGARQALQFQSTPPVEGGDCLPLTLLRWYIAFQSTPPVEGGDDRHGRQDPHGRYISIHATRGGWRRGAAARAIRVHRDFNPRHPWRVATTNLRRQDL